MRCGRGLAFQATLPVQPADKRLSLVLRSGLMIGPSLIERFDSDEASDLLARKTHVRELPHVRHGGELLSEFHSHPPVSLSRLLRAVGLPTSASSSSIRTSIGLPECSDPGLKSASQQKLLQDCLEVILERLRRPAPLHPAPTLPSGSSRLCLCLHVFSSRPKHLLPQPTP